MSQRQYIREKFIQSSILNYRKIHGWHGTALVSHQLAKSSLDDSGSRT